jgi:tetratricopeptide (TPR) repeat protein
MKAESIVFAVAGMCFGVILGWVIAVQQGATRPAAATAAPAAGGAGVQQQQAPALDEAKVQALTASFDKDPRNADTAVQLGNTYFDAERYQDAIKWYAAALDIAPNNADASTDLGVSYYYTGQTDRALQQFDVSLKIDARHTKTLLNQGIVRAFGKQDLAGAAESWKRVVELAPNSPEGQAASRALEGVAAAGHPAGTPAAPAN